MVLDVVFSIIAAFRIELVTITISELSWVGVERLSVQLTWNPRFLFISLIFAFSLIIASDLLVWTLPQKELFSPFCLSDISLRTLLFLDFPVIAFFSSSSDSTVCLYPILL